MPYVFRAARLISAVVLGVVLFTPSVYAQAIDPVRIAAVNLSYVAQSCKAGKAGLAQIDQLEKKKEAEAAMRAAELEQQRFELQQRGSMMSERARADLQKAFDKGRIDFERFQQDAQAELQRMQRQFEAEFRLKLLPVVDQISKDKGLHFVFGLEQSTMIVWSNPSLDISDEIVKRLDGDAKQ